MKLVYLFIDGYKNLHNIEFFFESDSTVNAIIEIMEVANQMFLKR